MAKRTVLRTLTILILAAMMISDALAQSPSVVLVTPPQNDLDVTASTSISITFDSDMDETTINDSTILVTSMLSGKSDGSISYDQISRIALFHPSTAFHYGDVVSVTVTDDVKSTSGIPLQDPFVWSFTVEANDGNGTFIRDSNYAVGESPFAIVAVDLDGDGDLDLATANSFSGTASVLLSDGDGHFVVDSTYVAGSVPKSICVYDFNGDGVVDLAIADGYSNNVIVFLNDGSGHLGSGSTHDVGDFPSSVLACDLDGDGHGDIVTANTFSNSISILKGNGGATFDTHIDYPVGTEPYEVACGDLDNDGDIDIVSCNDVTGNVSVLINNGSGSFAPRIDYSVVFGPISIVAADFDGDGDIDIATAHDSADSVSILMNSGSGIFAGYSAYRVGTKPVSIVAADFDDDGDLDIATADFVSGDVSYLSNLGNGSFAPYTPHRAAEAPQSLTYGDLDGDGDLDLAVANYSSENVSIMVNALVCYDTDGDGYGDPLHPENECEEDNCPFIYNPDQEDSDDDGVGDSCDICPQHPLDDCCNPIGSNLPPELTSTEIDTAMPGIPYSYVANAIDPNCDGSELVITYFVYPSWCDVLGDSLAGFPECDYADTIFRVSVTDGSMSDIIEVQLIVDKTNRPPVILDESGQVAARIGDEFHYYPQVYDPDDTTHEISYLAYPNWCTVRNDSVVGTVPDSLSDELLIVAVADYCHADTVSFVVSTYVCGDANSSIYVDIDDVVFLVNYIFVGGTAPDPYITGDADCTEFVDIDDLVYLLLYIYRGGPAPCENCP